jgi:hypothetical protein
MTTVPTLTGDELPDRWISREAAAAFLGLSPATLASWASLGCGPRFSKLSGGRSAAVRYSLLELRRFAEDPTGYSPRPVQRFNPPVSKGRKPVPIPGPNPAKSRRRRNGKARAS